MVEEPTTGIRKGLKAEIDRQVENNDPAAERKRLEALYGQVWNTEELATDFKVKGFMAPFCAVQRKSDGKIGSVEFQHHPRFYFLFREDK